MNSLNNQNKYQLEQKFQKFKALRLQELSQHHNIIDKAKDADAVLKETNMNECSQDLNPELSEELGKVEDTYHRLLRSVPRTPKILEIMLSDPNIFQYSQSLKKAAEQRNMEILVSSFPDRYQHLLEVEARANAKDQQAQQTIQKLAAEIEMLMDKLLKSEMRVRQQDSTLDEIRRNLRSNEENNKEEYLAIVRKKDLQITELSEKLDASERRVAKLKEDYRNNNIVLMELREQEEITQKQMQRLIQKLTEAEQKLTKSHKRLLQYDNEKKVELKNITEVHKNEIKQLGQRIQYLQQLLEQANSKSEYKECLITMAEQENQRNLTKLEKEVAVKEQQLLNLRSDHLEALKTIDELEDRINCLEQSNTIQWGSWCTEREQMKKQLEKSHQCNGELKAELEVKNELVRIQQKSIECMKSSFETQISKKTNEQLCLSHQLSQFQTSQQALQHQIQTQKQQISSQLSQVEQLLSQNKLLSTENRVLSDENSELLSENKELVQALQKLGQQTELDNTSAKMEQNLTLRKYLDIIVEQEEQIFQLRERVSKWISWCETKSTGSAQQMEVFVGVNQEDMGKLKQKNEDLETIIGKLKKQILILTKNSREHSSKGANILKDLIAQNKKLKSELSSLKHK